jgi:hypothetical protein
MSDEIARLHLEKEFVLVQFDTDGTFELVRSEWFDGPTKVRWPMNNATYNTIVRGKQPSADCVWSVEDVEIITSRGK